MFRLVSDFDCFVNHFVRMYDRENKMNLSSDVRVKAKCETELQDATVQKQGYVIPSI